MDVLIVTGSYPPETGGIGELMKGFTDALSSAGIGISVLASVDGSEKLSTDQIPVSEFRLPDAGYIRRVLACRAAVQQQLANGSFDRVLGSSWSPFAVGLTPLNFLRGVPVDILCHGMDLLEPARSWRYRTVLRRTLRSAATIIANSNFTASVSKNLGAPASRVLVLNPGIDAQRFAPGERPEQLANHLGIGPENRVLLSLSRLVPRKGFDLTLRALPRVLEAHPSTLYVIAGGGDRRVLRTGGISIITTPNVSHAGSVFKILLGRSNYERLDRSPMYLQDDEWRGHIRFYDKRELETLFGRHGLRLVHHSYYNEQGWGHARKSLVEVGKSLMKSPLALIPRYKRGHFAVFQKT